MFAVVAAAGAASLEVGSVSVSAPAEEPLIAHFVCGVRAACLCSACTGICCQRMLCSSRGAFVLTPLKGAGWREQTDWLEMGMEGWKVNRTCSHVQSHLLNGN